MRWKKVRESLWLEVAALAVISISVYLVHLGSLSYYRDDWYYMYDGLVGGGKIFVEMFRHLRPARGPLFQFLFDTFGLNPQPYLILLYLWRLAGSIGALWLFRMLWPRQRTATFFMALLYLIYPGFLWWVQGFEYQPMVLSAGLQVFSIAFTLKAIQSVSRRDWVLWMLAAFITGWASLAFVEYTIGMEAFRWLCIYLLVHRRIQPWKEKGIATIRAAAITLLIPLTFLFWHQFIFENERKAADLGLQAGAIFSSPSTALRWIIYFFQSLLNVSIFAWTSVFNQVFFSLRLREMLPAAGIALAVLTVTFIAQRWMHHADEEPASPPDWRLEAVSTGLLGVGAGVLPIIVANRMVTFERFSHYALPASVAAVMFVVGLIYLLSDQRVRIGVLSTLVGFSALTHASVAAQAREEERLIAEFWHQVAWRAPDLRPGTVLLVSYPGIDYKEGSDMVWGPANLIYYPEKQNQLPIRISVAAARMEADTARNILEGAELFQNYIVVNDIQYDFDNLLVMTMPSENACVHVLDSRWAELSVTDSPLIGLAAPKSRPDAIVMESEWHTPPEVVFGSEPTHEWCYYYQKAQLARQQGDWEAIAGINNEVAKLGLHPNDQIEWMPFLQAFAMLEDEAQVKQISTRINTEKLYKKQACQNLTAMKLSSGMRKKTTALFCNSSSE